MSGKTTSEITPSELAWYGVVLNWVHHCCASNVACVTLYGKTKQDNNDNTNIEKTHTHTPRTLEKHASEEIGSRHHDLNRSRTAILRTVRFCDPSDLHDLPVAQFLAERDGSVRYSSYTRGCFLDTRRKLFESGIAPKNVHHLPDRLEKKETCSSVSARTLLELPKTPPYTKSKELFPPQRVSSRKSVNAFRAALTF